MRTLLCSSLVEGRLLLDPAESHHLLHVLRATRGTTVRLSDGEGREAAGQLVGETNGRAELDVGPVLLAPPVPVRLVLLGAPRPALVEEAATLATEAGATHLWLVASERSPPGKPRLDRLDRVIDSAVKQCRRSNRPAIASFSALQEALRALQALPEGPGLARFVAQPGGTAVREELATGGAVLAVGSEGGWSPAELRLLQEQGFATLGRGPHILRAPTAVVAGLAALAVGRLSGW